MAARRRNVAAVGLLPGALVVGPRKPRALVVVFSGDAVVYLAFGAVERSK